MLYGGSNSPSPRHTAARSFRQQIIQHDEKGLSINQQAINNRSSNNNGADEKLQPHKKGTNSALNEITMKQAGYKSFKGI